MKVKVRKITLFQPEQEWFGDEIFLFDPPKTQEEYDRRVKEQQISDEKLRRKLEAESVLWEKYEKEYFKLFPDDRPIYHCLGCRNDDGWSEIEVYKWAVENKKHWYECPNLSESMSPERSAKAMREFLEWSDAHPEADASFG